MFLVWVLVACLNDSCSDPPRTGEVAWHQAVAEVQRPVGECLPGSGLQALCQRCAKVMKSAKAHRMCCTDDPGNSTESGRAYCKRLLDHTVDSVGEDFLDRERDVTVMPVV